MDIMADTEMSTGTSSTPCLIENNMTWDEACFDIPPPRTAEQINPSKVFYEEQKEIPSLQLIPTMWNLHAQIEALKERIATLEELLPLMVLKDKLFERSGRTLLNYQAIGVDPSNEINVDMEDLGVGQVVVVDQAATGLMARSATYVDRNSERFVCWGQTAEGRRTLDQMTDPNATYVATFTVGQVYYNGQLNMQVAKLKKLEGKDKEIKQHAADEETSE